MVLHFDFLLHFGLFLAVHSPEFQSSLVLLAWLEFDQNRSCRSSAVPCFYVLDPSGQVQFSYFGTFSYLFVPFGILVFILVLDFLGPQRSCWALGIAFPRCVGVCFLGSFLTFLGEVSALGS